ncbi:MAG: hypothetical protein IV093_15530 [Rubrivivax sp.]|nr:hypothetical protein [Rubrivivax sp.]
MHRTILARCPRGAALSLGVLASAVLVACGGGGTTDAATTAPTTAPTRAPLTALYFTDDFSAVYDAVWLSIERVTAVGPSGETELVAFAPARPFNLPALKQAGALVGNVALPADTTQVRVYVASTAQLQQLDGTVRQVALQAPGGYLAFRLDSWAATSGVLALDFDLPRFTLQADTLVAATRIAGHEDFSNWNQRFAESEGLVTAVSASALTVQTRHHGLVNFILDANTSYYSKTRGGTWTPRVGDRVEVNAAVAGQGVSALQFTATFVKDETEAAASGLGKIEGTVTAIHGSLLTMTVRDSQWAGATGAVSVDIAGATFTRGSAASLLPGVRVEAHVGASVGGTWPASAVEIEGAAKTGEDRGGDGEGHAYAEVKGVIQAVNGSQVTLMVMKSEWLAGAAPGSVMTVDLAGVYFKKGAASCLAVGAPLEVKGSADANGQLQPLQAELESGCAYAAPVDGVAPPTAGTSLPLGAFVEVKGAVTAVRPGEFDLSVYKIEYSGALLPTMTVRYSNTTLFKHFLPTQLASGQFLEVKGSWNGQALDASKVEAD